MPRESFSYWTRQYKRDYCKCVRLYECSVFFFLLSYSSASSLHLCSLCFFNVLCSQRAYQAKLTFEAREQRRRRKIALFSSFSLHSIFFSLISFASSWFVCFVYVAGIVLLIFFSLILFQLGSRWFIVLRGLGMLYDTFEATKKMVFLLLIQCKTTANLCHLSFFVFKIFRCILLCLFPSPSPTNKKKIGKKMVKI